MSAAISREQVEKVHGELFTTAKGIVEGGEEHESLVFGFADMGGELAPEFMAVYQLNEMSKRILPMILSGIAEKCGLAVHVCEAWAVNRNAEDVKDEDDPLEGVMPSECDDKIEVVIMIFIGDGWRAFAQHKIDTVDGKRSLAEGELCFEGKDHTFSGNLMGGQSKKEIQ
jgi:hypothetical protein